MGDTIKAYFRYSHKRKPMSAMVIGYSYSSICLAPCVNSRAKAAGMGHVLHRALDQAPDLLIEPNL